MKPLCQNHRDNNSLLSCSNDTMIETNKAVVECAMETKLLCFDFMTILFGPTSKTAKVGTSSTSKSSSSNATATATPKRICMMWKKKRHEEKEKHRQRLEEREQRQGNNEASNERRRRLRGEEQNTDDDTEDDSCALLSDFQLASRTKQNAQNIQRRFEKKFDKNNYSQRHERYGNRADFIMVRNKQRRA